MPVLLSRERPSGAMDLLRGPVCRSLGRGPSLEAAGGRGSGFRAFVSEPHACYSVGMESVARGSLLGAARFTGWRCLVVTDTGDVAEARLTAGADGGLSLTGIHFGPSAAATLSALRLAEAIDEVKKEEYELRYLDVSALHFAALWLARKGGDIVIPAAPTPSGVAALVPYAEAEIISRLRSLAVARTEAYAGDRTGRLGG